MDFFSSLYCLPLQVCQKRAQLVLSDRRHLLPLQQRKSRTWNHHNTHFSPNQTDNVPMSSQSAAQLPRSFIGILKKAASTSQIEYLIKVLKDHNSDFELLKTRARKAKNCRLVTSKLIERYENAQYQRYTPPPSLFHIVLYYVITAFIQCIPTITCFSCSIFE